jgi:hypothetical protein
VKKSNRRMDALLSSAGNEVNEGKKWGFGGFVKYS